MQGRMGQSWVGWDMVGQGRVQQGRVGQDGVGQGRVGRGGVGWDGRWVPPKVGTGWRKDEYPPNTPVGGMDKEEGHLLMNWTGWLAGWLGHLQWSRDTLAELSPTLTQHVLLQRSASPGGLVTINNKNHRSNHLYIFMYCMYVCYLHSLAQTHTHTYTHKHTHTLKHVCTHTRTHTHF